MTVPHLSRRSLMAAFESNCKLGGVPLIQLTGTMTIHVKVVEGQHVYVRDDVEALFQSFVAGYEYAKTKDEFWSLHQDAKR